MRRRHRRPLLITVSRSRSVDESARRETRDREQRARPGGENAPVRGGGSLLQNRIPARSCDLYDAYAVTRVERFPTEVADCRNTEDACDFGRDVHTVVVDGTRDGRRVIGALEIHVGCAKSSAKFPTAAITVTPWLIAKRMARCSAFQMALCTGSLWQ